MGKFVIGEFVVDVSRCKISLADTEQVVEPKVMDVLQFMYMHRGKVVSQEQIFSAVWPNATFSPSYVQRCIALLRKALNEDSKAPQFIITHPKRGYSLEVPQRQAGLNFSFKLSIACVALLLMGILIWIFLDHAKPATSYSQLTPITSNEANESSLSLAHNGEFLAFVRGDKNMQHIWLKELKTGKEVRLTEQPSTYLALAWRPDDRALAFIKVDNGHHQLAYFNLSSEGIAVAAQSKILTLTDTLVTSHKLQWANNGLIYFIEQAKSNNDTQLVAINSVTKQKHIVQKVAGQDWLKLHALSPNQQQLALGYESGQNKYRIDVLDISTGQSQTLITLEDGIQGLSWHSSGEKLLVSNSNNLLLVDLQGNVSDIPFNNYLIIRDAQFLPMSTDIIMELVKIDVDIIRSTRDEPEQFSTLVDTSSVDFLPVFSPDSSKFVFESHRSGLKQLFLYENGTQTLVFSNPNNEELFGIVWSKDGEEVITASKNALYRINLKQGSFERIPHAYHSFYLREMYHHEAAILVSYRGADGVTFHPAKFDLETLELTPYVGSGKRLACYAMDLDEHDQVYFSNEKHVFRLNANGELDTIWQSPAQEIIGLVVEKSMMTVTLADSNGYEMNEVDFETGAIRRIFKGQDEGKMLINTSHDFQEFLYLTEPKKTRTLVRLN